METFLHGLLKNKSVHIFKKLSKKHLLIIIHVSSILDTALNDLSMLMLTI